MQSRGTYIPPTLYAKKQRSYNCWERKEKMIFKENENKSKLKKNMSNFNIWHLFLFFSRKIVYPFQNSPSNHN